MPWRHPECGLLGDGLNVMTTTVGSVMLEVNRRALQAQWGFDPCAGMTVERAEDVGGPTPTNPSALQIRVPQGAWLTLHDADDPLAEARAQLLKALAADGVVSASYCVIGAGAGWMVDAIEERSPSARVLVLEPVPQFVAAMLSRRDFRSLITSGRLLILAGPAFDGVGHAWRVFGREVGSLTQVIHPTIAVARRDATIAAARLARRAFQDAQSNDEARRRFAAPYLLNTITNLPVVSREATVSGLFGLCAGQPVVIAGAGPSLNRNLEAMRPYRSRVVLVSADTALRPILAAGMAPDFVVAVDPGAPNARHLTNLPPCPDTVLVAEPSVQSRSFEAFAGRTFLYRVASHHPWPWLGASGIDLPILRAWGTVLVTAFDVALRLGGDPLIFIGADLAYTDGQPYCRGTVYEDDWADRVRSGETLEQIWTHAIGMRPVLVECHGDVEVSTGPHLMQFRDGLLHACRDADRRIINATGRGILRGHPIEAASLASVLEEAPPVQVSPLLRRMQSPRAVAQLWEALRARTLASPDGVIPAEWQAVLDDHVPPDPSIRDGLAQALAEVMAFDPVASRSVS